MAGTLRLWPAPHSSKTIKNKLSTLSIINSIQSLQLSNPILHKSPYMRQAGTYSGILTGGISGRTGPHSLPLARIKKIMKRSGEDVKMISGEAPIVFSKACELFIEELTHRAWMVTLQGKRRTLHKEDVASAIMATDIFDFLAEMVANESKDRASGAAGSSERVEELETDEP